MSIYTSITLLSLALVYCISSARLKGSDELVVPENVDLVKRQYGYFDKVDTEFGVFDTFSNVKRNVQFNPYPSAKKDNLSTNKSGKVKRNIVFNKYPSTKKDKPRKEN